MDIEKCDYCGNDVFRAIKVIKWVYQKYRSIYGAWQCQKCHVAVEMEWQKFEPLLKEMERKKREDDYWASKAGAYHGTKT